MSEELRRIEGFGENVSNVGVAFHPFDRDDIVVDELAKEVVLDVDVLGAIAMNVVAGHGDCRLIVGVDDDGERNFVLELSEELFEEDDLLGGFDESHEFGFGGRESDGGLLLRLPGDEVVVDVDTETGGRLAIGAISTPIRVTEATDDGGVGSSGGGASVSETKILGAGEIAEDAFCSDEVRLLRLLHEASEEVDGESDVRTRDAGSIHE